MLERYMFCLELHSTALRQLRLDLTAGRRGGTGRVLELLCTPGDRGMRLALHLDVALSAYNRIRHDMGGTCVQSLQFGLKTARAALTRSPAHFVSARLRGLARRRA